MILSPCGSFLNKQPSNDKDRTFELSKETCLIDLQLSVVAMEPKPSEKTRTIININMKEYVNHGKVAQDKGIIQINKKSFKTEGDRYSFSTTKGINFGVGGHFGAQVMGAAVAGGSIGISGHYDKSKSIRLKKQSSRAQKTLSTVRRR